MRKESGQLAVGGWQWAVGRKKVLSAECGVLSEERKWAVGWGIGAVGVIGLEGLSLEREKSEYYYRMSFIETLCTNIKHNWACCFSANVTGVMG